MYQTHSICRGSSLTSAPAFVSVFEYSFLIFACLWSFLLWGMAASSLVWAGIVVIIASGLAMSFLQKREG